MSSQYYGTPTPSIAVSETAPSLDPESTNTETLAGPPLLLDTIRVIMAEVDSNPRLECKFDSFDSTARIQIYPRVKLPSEIIQKIIGAVTAEIGPSLKRMHFLVDGPVMLHANSGSNTGMDHTKVDGHKIDIVALIRVQYPRESSGQ
ncbi:hypothetical protein NUW58_g1247 [Xylaria curta]|uniref:Uncharacterized protein n=1 Tax=Xylaria curta TaxID=42375 RepID=A0ACC1PNL5_9PEZI|nr:hypothetical protein NUW58_g1247 [Xylaria curta]